MPAAHRAAATLGAWVCLLIICAWIPAAQGACNVTLSLDPDASTFEFGGEVISPITAALAITPASTVTGFQGSVVLTLPGTEACPTTGQGLLEALAGATLATTNDTGPLLLYPSSILVRAWRCRDVRPGQCHAGNEGRWDAPRWGSCSPAAPRVFSLWAGGRGADPSADPAERGGGERSESEDAGRVRCAGVRSLPASSEAQVPRPCQDLPAKACERPFAHAPRRTSPPPRRAAAKWVVGEHYVGGRGV